MIRYSCGFERKTNAKASTGRYPTTSKPHARFDLNASQPKTTLSSAEGPLRSKNLLQSFGTPWGDAVQSCDPNPQLFKAVSPCLSISVKTIRD